MQAQPATNIIPMAAHRPEYVTRTIMRRLARRLPAIRQQRKAANSQLQQIVTRNEQNRSPLLLIALAAAVPVLALWLRR